ncbi:hypothetical protein [Streptomyces sp. NBC_01190]|uniref:hypothetical protein n=1 Tax=Streptomyces sp. NBC_01190 TaxID=2903767 RepID=UPI00386B7131|nr:hypothetical protein OG519_16290 [Streptomyces sp. NBC_01190]
MSPRDARIAALSARLAATGLVPELKEYADRTSIEAEVPTPFPDASWPAVLAVLEAADTFGFADNSTRGRSLWAVVYRGAASPPSDPPDQP